MPFQKILIAVDSEPVAAHAAEMGVELAHAVGAQVGLISVIDSSLADSVATDVAPAELLAQLRADAKQLIAALRLKVAPGPTTLAFTPEGSPGQEIVKAAKDWPADMIVIGSHGRSGLGRVLLGSVAEAVMRHAPCPVLIVRGRD
jgi:nucleotide-binding universal stress UspA family protein